MIRTLTILAAVLALSLGGCCNGAALDLSTGLFDLDVGGPNNPRPAPPPPPAPNARAVGEPIADAPDP